MQSPSGQIGQVTEPKAVAMTCLLIAPVPPLAVIVSAKKYLPAPVPSPAEMIDGK